MTVTSASQTQYTQATNKTTATKATSAYESTAPAQTQQTDKMAEMKEKYKDVYSPMPSVYSKERSELPINIIKEKYPNYLSAQEAVAKYAVKVDFNNPGSVEAKAENEVKSQQYIQDHGGVEALQKENEFVFATFNKYPQSFATADFTPSNAKELSAFYDGAVYEGLEQGENIETARQKASMAVQFMDTSEVDTHNLNRMMPLFKNSAQHLLDIAVAEKGSEISNEELAKLQQQGIGQGDTVDLSKYGFNMSWNHIDNKPQNDKAMASVIENRISMYNFMLGNPDIVQREFQKLGTSTNRESGNVILKPISEQYLPNAQRALDVFSKYKIYDSVDVRG